MVWNSREQRHIQMAFNYEPIQFLFHLSRQNEEDFSGILNPITCASHLRRVQMTFMGLSESVASYVKQFRYCLQHEKRNAHKQRSLAGRGHDSCRQQVVL